MRKSHWIHRSIGIAQQWVGNASNENKWRDTHIQIEGSVFLGLRAEFLDNWNEASDWLYEELPGNTINLQFDIPVQTLRSSNTTDWTDIVGMIRALISI